MNILRGRRSFFSQWKQVVRVLVCLTMIASCPKARSECYRVDQTNDLPLAHAKIMAAIGRVKHDDNRCSGTKVSSQGHVLTDLHCLEQCLVENEQLDFHTDPLAEDPAQGRYLVRTVHEQAPKDLFCKRLKFENSDQFIGGAKVILMGKGFGTVRSESISTLTKDEFESISDKLEDFALVQYPKLVGDATLPLSETTPSSDEKIWVYGYPSYGPTTLNCHSNGDGLYVSIGKIRPSLLEDPVLRVRYQADPSAFDRQFILNPPERVLYSDASFVVGASGGAVTSNNGSIEAVFYSNFKPLDGQTLIPSTLAVRSSHILDLAKKMLPDTWSSIFRNQNQMKQK